MYVCVGTSAHLSIIFKNKVSSIDPLFWTNKNKKKDELYYINVANYVYKVVSYDYAAFELKEILRTIPVGMLSKKM